MKKKLMLIFIAIIMALCLFSCGETDGSGENDDGVVKLKAVENLSEYFVVRSDTSSDAVTMMTSSFRKLINSKTSASVGIKTDATSQNYEILIGLTKRQESVDAYADLRYYDYLIKKVGNKIIIAGGSEEALKSAIELVEQNFIDEEAGVLKIPTGAGYKYEGNYIVDKLSVEGVELNDFKLFNNSLLKKDGEEIAALRAALGYELKVETADVMLKTEKYIYLDGSNLMADEYSIKIVDGNIEIKGSAHSLPAAIEYFVGDYIKNLAGSNYNLTSANDFEGSTGKKEIYSKDDLAKVIRQIYDDPGKIVIGEEVQGGTNATTIADCIQKFVDATGEMPGIMGIDLACYGIDLMKTNDLQWSSFICDLVDYCAGGGMVTASAHWENPSGNTMGDARCRGELGYEDSLEAYEKAFTDLITEGTEYNTFFKKELATNARFFKALEDNGVTIIWRPLHEANGGWFWFCTTQGSSKTLDPSYVVNVWHYIYDYFTVECGLTNLYWCYGPNYSANVNDNHGSTMSTTYLYPGDEYCDMVGVDWYSSGNLEITENDNYLRLVDLARKPGAITEFGPAGGILGQTVEDQPGIYNCMDLYGNLYELTREGYSFVYLLTWGGKWGVPAMGKGEEFMQTDLAIGQAEVKAMLDALK